jgi:cytidylate kinase
MPSETARIVEKQMRNWELAKAQHPPPATGRRIHQVEDFITLSRMVGAGGSQFAQTLGERLSWPVFDKQILQAMAGDDQVRARLYEALDERDVSWIDDTLRWLLEGEFRQDVYFHRLSETILALARKGPAVFLGRGADLILPRDRGLRIYLIASRETCLHNFAQRNAVSEELARTLIDRIQHERDEFVRRRFGRAASRPTRYDLVLNMTHLTLPEGVELVCQALRLRGVVP